MAFGIVDEGYMDCCVGVMYGFGVTDEGSKT